MLLRMKSFLQMNENNYFQILIVNGATCPCLLLKVKYFRTHIWRTKLLLYRNENNVNNKASYYQSPITFP